MLVLVATAMLTACAGGPTNAELHPVEPGTRVNVIVILPDVQAPNALDTGEAVGRGAGSMAAQGAALGVYASAECGPLFFVCMPFSVVGLAAGASVELIVNGESVETIELQADGHVEDLQFNYKPKRSCWVAVRIFPRVIDTPWIVHAFVLHDNF